MTIAAMRRAYQALTAKDVERVLKGKKPNGRYLDGQGLSIVVRNDGGAASWVLTNNPPRPAKQKQYAVGSVVALGSASGSEDSYAQAAASLREARIIASRMRERIAQGLPAKEAKTVQSAAVTFQDILDYYCEQKKIDQSKIEKYAAPYRKIVANHVDGVFTRDMSLKYREAVLKTMKPSTAKTNIKMLAAIFNLYIVDNEADFKNPFQKINVEDTVSDISKRDPMPPEIIKAVRDKLTGDDVTIWNMLVLSGARIGEIVGIRSADVLDGFLKIEPNAKRDLKNASSKRVIPMLLKLPARDSEFYFANTVNAITVRLALVIRKVTADTKITTHSLRHAVTDTLREGGIDSIFEDFFLGHAPNSVAASSYGSLESRAKIMAAKINPVMKAYAKRVGIDIPIEESVDELQ